MTGMLEPTPPAPALALPGDLQTRLLGRVTVEYHQEVASTNTRARELALAGAPEGTLVWAESQSGGRGRLGRPWHSPPGAGLYFSLILDPWPKENPSFLTLAAGLSVAEAINQMTSLQPGIKWPNDLLIQDKKIAGILAELDSGGLPPRFVVLGVGVNVNLQPTDIPDEIRDTAGSLLAATGKTWDRSALLGIILEKIEGNYLGLKAGRHNDILQRYRRNSITIGARVRVRQGHVVLEGQVRDVDHRGRLLLESTSGGSLMAVEAGEVSLVRPVF